MQIFISYGDFHLDLVVGGIVVIVLVRRLLIK
jgi:hypothetical protein